LANGELNGKNGRGLLIGGGIGGSVLVTVLSLGWTTLRSDMKDNRDEFRAAVRELHEENNELRRDLKEIQRLAAERGKVIPEHERRLDRLEQRR